MRDFGDAQPYCFLLSRLGTASGLTNDVAQPLSGVWSEEPVVAVGLSSIQTFDPSHAASLYIETGVSELTYKGGGVYNVSAYARLTSTGGQYSWGVSYGPTTNTWDIGVYPTESTYISDWSDTYSDISGGYLYFYIQTRRCPSYGYYGQTTINIYIDYVRQDTGATVSQLVYTSIIGTMKSGTSWLPFTLSGYLGGTLSNLATRARIRLVATTGPASYAMGDGWAASSLETVSLRGITFYKDESSGSTTLYNGSVFALAVGR